MEKRDNGFTLYIGIAIILAFMLGMGISSNFICEHSKEPQPRYAFNFTMTGCTAEFNCKCYGYNPECQCYLNNKTICDIDKYP
jgi:hypothetical protein